MVRKLTASQVKATILRLLDEVAAGEEVEITKHGRTVAKLVSARGPRALEGMLEGVAVSTEDDEQLYSTGLEWHLN